MLIPALDPKVTESVITLWCLIDGVGWGGGGVGGWGGIVEGMEKSPKPS